MRWGEKQTGGVIDYPGFLYRQLLTRSQMEGGLEGGHHSGVANLIRDKCANGDDESGTLPSRPSLWESRIDLQTSFSSLELNVDSDEIKTRRASSPPSLLPRCSNPLSSSPSTVSQEADGTEDSVAVNADEACCGYDPPRYCHQPEFLHLRMREYYPQTAYYLANPDPATGKLRLTPVKA